MAILFHRQQHLGTRTWCRRIDWIARCFLKDYSTHCQDQVYLSGLFFNRFNRSRQNRRSYFAGRQHRKPVWCNLRYAPRAREVVYYSFDRCPHPALLSSTTSILLIDIVCVVETFARFASQSAYRKDLYTPYFTTHASGAVRRSMASTWRGTFSRSW